MDKTTMTSILADISDINDEYAEDMDETIDSCKIAIVTSEASFYPDIKDVACMNDYIKIYTTENVYFVPYSEIKYIKY